jgi:hypothetical protein
MATSVADRPAAQSGDADRPRVMAARRHLYDAENALHAARQTHIDAWIDAAYGRLHAAVEEHLRALAESPVPNGGRTESVDAAPEKG